MKYEYIYFVFFNDVIFSLYYVVLEQKHNLGQFQNIYFLKEHLGQLNCIDDIKAVKRKTGIKSKFIDIPSYWRIEQNKTTRRETNLFYEKHEYDSLISVKDGASRESFEMISHVA